jgi:uncharacterized protein YbdZ (MbtH family)
MCRSLYRQYIRTQQCCVPTGWGLGEKERRSPFFPEYIFGRDTALPCPNLFAVLIDFISRFTFTIKIMCDISRFTFTIKIKRRSLYFQYIRTQQCCVPTGWGFGKKATSRSPFFKNICLVGTRQCRVLIGFSF